VRALLKTPPTRLIVANRRTCEACIRDAGGTCGAPCPCPADGTSAVIHAAAGDCPAGKFGDHPKGLAKVLHGAAGVAKALTGTDRADDAEIERRRAVCAGCEYARLTAGVFRSCSICGCSLRLKILVKGEVCPKGKWAIAPTV
jgi:hypothetical protein